MYEEFKKDVAIVEQPSADQTYKLKSMLEDIEMYQNLPICFSLAIVATFLGYLISTLLSLWWLLEWNREIMNEWLLLTFGLSTFLFMGVGLASIYLVISAMNRDSEEFKRKLGETKSQPKGKNR